MNLPSIRYLQAGPMAPERSAASAMVQGRALAEDHVSGLVASRAAIALKDRAAALLGGYLPGSGAALRMPVLAAPVPAGTEETALAANDQPASEHAISI